MNLTRDTIQPTTGVWWELEAEVQGRAPTQTSSLPGLGQAGKLPHPPPHLAAFCSSPHNHRQQMALNRQRKPGPSNTRANQMSGNEKVAHEEYHLIRLHHLSKTDGLFIVPGRFWICTAITQQVRPSLALPYLLQSGYRIWKHCGLTHPRSEGVNLGYTLESSGGLWKCCLGPTIELAWGVQPGHWTFFLLKAPRDGGAWWAAVYRVAQSRTRL